MNTLWNNLLLSLPMRGLLWSIFLFAICFFGVHFTQLARLGMTYCAQQKRGPIKEETEKEKSPPAEKIVREPIYYIVEKKQRHINHNYGKPKEIRFKSTD